MAGPEVFAALLCRRVEQDEFGLFSAVGVLRAVQLDVSASMPADLFVGVRESGPGSRRRLNVVRCDPSGVRTLVGSIALTFPPGVSIQFGALSLSIIGLERG